MPTIPPAAARRPAPSTADAVTLDIRHLAEPQNAYAWMAAHLRAERYTEQELPAATAACEWQDTLAETFPEHTSPEPIVLAVLSRAATDGGVRAHLIECLTQLDDWIEAQAGQG